MRLLLQVLTVLAIVAYILGWLADRQLTRDIERWKRGEE